MDPHTEALRAEELLSHAGWLSSLARSLVDIAQAGNLGVFDLYVGVKVRRASSSNADQTDMYAVVSANDAGGGSGHSGALEESPTGKRAH